MNSITPIPNGLREMLEEFVRSVVLSKIKSRDLYKYANQYFREYKTNLNDDIMGLSFFVLALPDIRSNNRMFEIGYRT